MSITAPDRILTTEEAISFIENVLYTVHVAQGGRIDTKVELLLWAPESLAAFGPRVAEVTYSTENGGASFMQSDLETGLAVCAAAERSIICLTDPIFGSGDYFELDQLVYLCSGGDFGVKDDGSMIDRRDVKGSGDD